MKKLALTIAIVLGMSMTTFADGGGLFQRGAEPTEMNSREGGSILTPGLPGHGETGNQDAPLTTGIMILTALGAGYLIGKKRREEF